MVDFIEDKELFKTAKVVFDTREDSEERTKWLSLRCNSIGGSEIGAIAGFSAYGTALTVFNEKLYFDRNIVYVPFWGMRRTRTRP